MKLVAFLYRSSLGTVSLAVLSGVIAGVSKHRAAIGRLLSELKARGKTVVVISHDYRYFNVADRKFLN